MNTPAPVTDPQLAEMKSEAMDPSLSEDWVTLGFGDQEKRLKVRHLKWRAEKQIAKLVAPHLGKLDGLQTGNLDSLGAILYDLADVLPACVAVAFERDGITEEWLDENANAAQLVEAAKAQLAKNSLVDVLGKLFKTAVPAK